LTCGERSAGDAAMATSTGSSPRVRGTGPFFSWHQYPGRFIPACAGNGISLPTLIVTIAVHPRVCGERV